MPLTDAMPATEAELALEMAHRPGLIPTAIDAAAQRVIWVDWEGYHFYEGFFHDSLATYTKLRGSAPASFSSSLESLKSARILNPQIGGGCMEPAGFIFHAGRCGSTLLAKSLARSRRNVVFGEAAPHNQIWPALAPHADTGVGTYRNLLLLMGRRRLPSYTAHIVKFTSFNIMQFRFIRRAFPHVPALFLFRAPQAILESCRRKEPKWLGKELGIGRTWESPEAAVEDYFNAALSVDEAEFHCLDYEDLVAGALPAILGLFRLEPTRDELRLMESELAWDAKSLAPRPFVPRSRPFSGVVPERLNALYDRLRNHAPVPVRPSVKS